MLALVALVLGCDAPTDRDLYQRAASAQPDQAALVCAEIEEPRLKGECLAFAGASWAKAGRLSEAGAACEAITDPLWAEECWFLSSDEASLTGDRAVATCRHAGRFRTNCLGHAIGREVRHVERLHGKLGDEAALEQALEEVVARYKPAAPASQRQATSDTLVARILAARGDGPFDERHCGSAPRRICARAYRVSLDAAPGEVDVEGLCVRGVDLEGVVEVGARPWAEGTEELAQEVWRDFCDELASGHIDRAGTFGMGTPPRAPPPPGGFPGER